jgi:hypothetical protein
MRARPKTRSMTGSARPDECGAARNAELVRSLRESALITRIPARRRNVQGDIGCSPRCNVCQDVLLTHVGVDALGIGHEMRPALL